MNDALREFVASHPDFFEKKGGYHVLCPDIHEMMERYARLVDADEYERVQNLVDSVRKENQELIESRIRANQEEVKQFEMQLPDILARLNDYDDAIAQKEQEIAGLKNQLVVVPTEQKPWYSSSLVFWLLAILGLLCMYVGIFIAVSGASSFLPIGLMILLLGVGLQSRRSPDQRRSNQKAELIQQDCQHLESELQLLKIKRATCLQQKMVARQNLEKLRMEIRSYQQRQHILND
jgi:septal ring factor EnvC (AmiA/AmiB activator)